MPHAENATASSPAFGTARSIGAPQGRRALPACRFETKAKAEGYEAYVKAAGKELILGSRV
jgi:hypothetical protein